MKLYNRKIIIKHIINFSLTLLLLGCGDENLPPGIIASVNDEPVKLHSLQTLLDSRSTFLNLNTDTSFDELRKNYANALGILIANTLVRQELAERGLEPTENELKQTIERIVSDMGEENLESFLEEELLNANDWKEMVKDHLALEIFRNRILLPAIKIEFSEVKGYYQQHQKEFMLPERVKACFLTSENRQEIIDWCADVPQRNYLTDSIAQCVEVKLDEIPQQWNKELKNLKPNACGKIHEEGGEWQSVALLEHQPARIPELPEVYAVVEKILIEPKQTAAFDQWLENKIKSSTILVAPDLQECFALNRTLSHQPESWQNGDAENKTEKNTN